MKFRPSAIPLITVDPYFSIWSFCDTLYGDVTRHWTGQRNAMLGMIKIDGKTYRFMGKTMVSDEKYFNEIDVIPQVSVDVKPLTTSYAFENNTVILAVNFLTPLLLDDLTTLSRPVSYIYYDIKIKDNLKHDISVYFEISGEVCVDNFDQEVEFTQDKGKASCGNKVQNILNKSGDDTRIDWGYLYLVHPHAFVSSYNTRHQFIKNKEFKSVDISEAKRAREQFGLATISSKLSDMICVAYDDIYSVEYFHEQVKAYYLQSYESFEHMLSCAIMDFDSVKERSKVFEMALKSQTDNVNEYYSDITALAYRQTIAAHKLVSHGGEALFLSKECFSNGCIATLDVTYPSIPLFLKFNPELVKAMLRPLFRYARTSGWTFPFAPHDCGQYPLCNGQVYGDNKLEMQMPVEECGNALITVAAIAHYEQNTEFLDANKDLLDKWADYLVENGYNPGNQLCTDDFAGHFAGNCNLSVKAIVALGAYGKYSHQNKYMEVAKDMANRWSVDAVGKCGTMLAFGQPDTWSLKYNLVWDKLLDLGLFENILFEKEIETYTSKMNKYGIPLDYRSDYTKVDWLAWTTILSDDKAYINKLYKAVWEFISQAPHRVPITDWYYSSTSEQVIYEGAYVGFQNRTVLGAIFINLL